MLKLKDLIENFDLAREALSHYDCDEETLGEYLCHFRISANAIYPFAAGGQVRFLRMAPVEEKDEAELRAELEFLHYLESRAYPALRPVRTRGGEELLRLNTRWGEYFVCAFTGVPGAPIEDLPLTEELARRYGEALARLHVLSAEYAPRQRRQDHAALLGSVRAQLKEHGAPEDLLLACDSLSAGLGSIERTKENYGLVHYDFEPDNVFFDSATGLCHAIDFDDSVYCWYALDIEQALECIAPEMHEAFLAGYAALRPLEGDLPALRRLMRRLVDLRSFARLSHALSEPADPEPDWMPGLRARLQARLGQLEANIRASLDD